MEIIKALKNLKPLKSSVLTVGNYDGIHLGHQDVINHIVEFGKKNAIPSCVITCLLYTSPSPRDLSTSRMPSSA